MAVIRNCGSILFAGYLKTRIPLSATLTDKTIILGRPTPNAETVGVWSGSNMFDTHRIVKIKFNTTVELF